MALLSLEQKNQGLDYIKQRISPEQFATWFKPVNLQERETGVLDLDLPNVYYQTWFEKHYQDLIVTAFKETLQRTYRIRFNITNQSSAFDANNSPAPDSATQPTLFKDNPPETATAVIPPPRINKPRTEFSLNPKFTFEHFVVGPCNRFAHAATLGVAENPAKAYNPLFLHGAVGLGKTHLLQALCHTILQRSPESKIAYLSCEGFVNAYISAVKSRGYDSFRNKYRSVDVLVIDDIHFLGAGEKQASQEEFFHTFNALHNAQKQIVLSSDSPPKDIPTLEERLTSRFKWGLVVPLDPPDFETRVAILKNKAELHKTSIPDEVINFVATNIDTNIRDLEGAIVKVTGLAQLTNRVLDLELAQEALKDLVSVKTVLFTINDIQEMVSRFFHVSVSDIQSKKRVKSIALSRQIGMYLTRTMTGHSLEEIGAGFGGKDHTTVMYAVEKVKNRIQKDKQFKELVTRLVHELKKKRE